MLWDVGLVCKVLEVPIEVVPDLGNAEATKYEGSEGGGDDRQPRDDYESDMEDNAEEEDEAQFSGDKEWSGGDEGHDAGTWEQGEGLVNRRPRQDNLPALVCKYAMMPMMRNAT